MDLKQKSIEIIKKNQDRNGAYVASPNFETYNFCWLRDGGFISYAMDLVGEYSSVERFFEWVDETIVRYRHQIDALIKKKGNGEIIEQSDYLPARYLLNGLMANDDWTNFQLDGYGTWLWALTEHIKMTGRTRLIDKFSVSINSTVSYLLNFWDTPNYDCWEEFGAQIHTSTLACIYGGLKSINEYLMDHEISECLEQVYKFINEQCVINGRLSKFVGRWNTDASLLWACLPFGLFEVDDEIIKNTVKDIEDKLLHRGGVHRYPEDTYYGGGEWLLLSCWLGWYYSATGRNKEAFQIKKWVENQADEEGNLPEQVTFHPLKQSAYPKWVKRWGEVAKPLLWSHAMYLVLLREFEERGFH